MSTASLQVWGRALLYINRTVRLQTPQGEEAYIGLGANLIERPKRFLSLVPVLLEEPLYGLVVVQGVFVPSPTPDQPWRFLLKPQKVIRPDWAPDVPIGARGYRAAVGAYRTWSDARVLQPLRRSGYYLAESGGLRFILVAWPGLKPGSPFKLVKGRTTEVAPRGQRVTLFCVG